MLLDKPNGYSNNYFLYHDLYAGLAVVETIGVFKVIASKCHENLTRIYELSLRLDITRRKITKGMARRPIYFL